MVSRGVCRQRAVPLTNGTLSRSAPGSPLASRDYFLSSPGQTMPSIFHAFASATASNLCAHSGHVPVSVIPFKLYKQLVHVRPFDSTNARLAARFWRAE